jgi:hypothetical protein
MRKVKCRACLQFDDKEKMVKEDKAGYFHEGECYEKYLRHKQFKEKENAELDELYITIKEIYGLEIVPKQLFPLLQDIRNGNVNNRGKVKKYKQGVPYRIINEAYLMAKNDIQKARTYKQFTSTLGELKYGLAIVMDRINEIAKRKRKAEQSMSNIDKLREHTQLTKELQYKVDNLVKQNNTKNDDDDNEIDLTTLLD